MNFIDSLQYALLKLLKPFWISKAGCFTPQFPPPHKYQKYQLFHLSHFSNQTNSRQNWKFLHFGLLFYLGTASRKIFYILRSTFETRCFDVENIFRLLKTANHQSKQNLGNQEVICCTIKLANSLRKPLKFEPILSQVITRLPQNFHCYQFTRLPSVYFCLRKLIKSTAVYGSFPSRKFGPSLTPPPPLQPYLFV